MLMFRLASNIYAAINGITQKFHLGLSSPGVHAEHAREHMCASVCACMHVCASAIIIQPGFKPVRRGVRSVNSSVKSEEGGGDNVCTY